MSLIIDRVYAEAMIIILRHLIAHVAGPGFKVPPVSEEAAQPSQRMRNPGVKIGRPRKYETAEEAKAARYQQSNMRNRRIAAERLERRNPP